MNGAEFDSSMQPRSFSSADAMRADSQFRRRASLAISLWGRSSDFLQHQLLASHPEIPAGFQLADFYALKDYVQKIQAASTDPRFAFMSPAISSAIIFVGTQSFTEWEARYEIVNRAIRYLESH